MGEPYREVRRLADVAFPRSYQHKYMWSLTAYMDETGSYEDPNVRFVGMAGVLATEDYWIQFETEWKGILVKYDLPYFHMKDFAHRRKAFVGWSEQKRRDLLGELMGAIRGAYCLPFGTTIPMEPFKKYPIRIRDIIGNHPYYLSFLACTVILADLMAPARAYGEKIALVFAELDEFNKSETESTKLWRKFTKPVTCCIHLSSGLCGSLCPFRPRIWLHMKLTKKLTGDTTDPMISHDGDGPN